MMVCRPSLKPRVRASGCSQRSSFHRAPLVSPPLICLEDLHSMVFHNALVFDDVGLESAFRCHWEATSRSLIVLLSMVTGLLWAVALYNIRSHCRWSYMLCCLVQLVCVCSITVQAYFQVLFARSGRWHVPEVNKAYVFLADLIASMIFVMLLRDLEEVPGGTHVWMYSVHGVAILFLQCTSTSAFHFHALNLFAFVLVELFTWYELGRQPHIAQGLGNLALMVVFCGVVPFIANIVCELQSRRAFLQRCPRGNPAVERQWLTA